MKERLQKILSARGVASRRKAEEMIQNGMVSVNGLTAVLGDSADPEIDESLFPGRKAMCTSYCINPEVTLRPFLTKRAGPMQPSWWQNAAFGSIP